MPPEEMTSSTSFVVDRYWCLHTIDNPYNRLLKAAIMKETTPKNGVDLASIYKFQFKIFLALVYQRPGLNSFNYVNSFPQL
jgi:hypothetical protein